MWCTTSMKMLTPENRSDFKYLLKLLSSVINDTQPEKPNGKTDWASVFSFAECHSVAGMTSYAVQKLPDEYKPSQEIMDKFIEAQRCELILESNIQFETDCIISYLNERKITVMLLKGMILKHYYPVSSMRTMSDVDLLYKPEDKKMIQKAFDNMGYKLTLDFSHELHYNKPPFYHYEVHPSLVTEDKFSYDYFKDVWSKAVVHESGYTRLNLEDTYIYMMEHLAKHIEKSGAGIRMLMDVYVFLRKEKDTLNFEYIEKEFEKLRLNDFARKITELAFNWFENSDPDTESTVADYLLSSSTFGTVRNAILQNNIRKEQKTGKKQNGIKYLLSKLFPTHSHICGRFPKAKGRKVLYPFYLIGYWYLRFFKDKNVNTSNIGNYFAKTDSEEGRIIMNAINDLGLSQRIKKD